VLADIYDITLTSLEQLMECDVVISLVPLTPETKQMIGEKELNLLRPRSVFVNVSRGAVVDQAAAVVILQHVLDTERASGTAPGEIIEEIAR
jgi:phosphoglycerate dehydrogenase-like enzyme